ncbi:MAG: T9SS type A sorting domain-containing protein [Rhodothermaceae bacterium]|nr:T9SS type A sorting domain-containing protein [Rhodothermaceae bacterium]
MKKAQYLTSVLSIFLLAITHPATAQVGTCTEAQAQATLEVGNIHASIFNNGRLFFDNNAGKSYEVPKGSGVNSIFASTFLIGGLIEDTLRISSSTFGPYEFWPGPLDANGNPPSDCSAYDRIWEIKTSDFEQYEGNGSFSSNMLNWPWELGAPIIDGDGIPDNYNLEGGDRPELLGDQMLWWVMNDRGNEHKWSKEGAIGLEVHVSVYAFEHAKSGGDITFYRYLLTNKNKSPFKDAYLGFFADPDLGNFDDDYIGSDSLLHLGYTYNSDSFDEEGYGNAPPALGYTFLITPEAQTDTLDNDHDGEVDESGEQTGMYSFSFFDRSAILLGEEPAGRETYNRLRGLWIHGHPITVGGNGVDYSTQQTRFMYPGDPTTGSFWTEIQPTLESNIPNQTFDRRFVISGGPFTLEPGESTELLMAVVWAQGANNLDSVRKLKGIVGNMQSTPESYLTSGYRPGQFDQQPPTPESPLGFDQNFPNPFISTTTLRYSLPKTMDVRLAVYDLLGREITVLAEGAQEAGIYTEAFDGAQMPPGVYFARLEADHLQFTKLMVRGQ